MVDRNVERHYDALNRLVDVVQPPVSSIAEFVKPVLPVDFDGDGVLPVTLVDIDDAAERAGQPNTYYWHNLDVGLEPQELRGLPFYLLEAAYDAAGFDITRSDTDALGTGRLAIDPLVRLRVEKTGEAPNGSDTDEFFDVSVILFQRNMDESLTEIDRVLVSQIVRTVNSSGLLVAQDVTQIVEAVVLGFETQAITYVYDALNRNLRVSYDAGPVDTRRIVYDGWREAETEETGSAARNLSFLYGNGIDEKVALLDRDASEIYVYTDNTIGTLTGLSDADGNLVEYYQYSQTGRPAIFDANNVPLAASLVGNPFFQHGRRWDAEQGCYYYRNRFYSPDLGRFIHRDPTGQADGPNQYQFCNNNPLNCSDPTGTKWIWPDLGSLQTWREFGEDVGRGLWDGLRGLTDSVVSAAKTFWQALTALPTFIQQQWKTVKRMINLVKDLFTRMDRGTIWRVLDLYDPVPAGLIMKTTSALHYHATVEAVIVGAFLVGIIVKSAFYVVEKFSDWLTKWKEKRSNSKFSGGGESTERLYRGVNKDHPGFEDAKRGKATPRGGHSDPILHNEGDTRSEFTSWTQDPEVAKDYAGPKGVVLEKDIPSRQLVTSPDDYREYEVLVRGEVTGAKAHHQE